MLTKAMLSIGLLISPAIVLSQTTHNHLIPAGMLITCTMQEQNFSLKTAQVGDPVLCHLHTIIDFGKPLVPTGSYLTGRLSDGSKPGHFVGKGAMYIEFDRLVVPDNQYPVSMKVTFVDKKQNVNVQADGTMKGKGHTKRDTAMWMIPLTTPIAAATVAERGPYPTLKGGHENITLRVMEDTMIPVSDPPPTPVQPVQQYVQQPYYVQPQPVPQQYRPTAYIPATQAYVETEEIPPPGYVVVVPEPPPGPYVPPGYPNPPARHVNVPQGYYPVAPPARRVVYYVR